MARGKNKKGTEGIKQTRLIPSVPFLLLLLGYALPMLANAQVQRTGDYLSKMDRDGDGKVSLAEFTTAHPGKDSKFADMDANKDGFIDAAEHKAHSEGKCGEGKCGADKKTGDAKAEHAEGKCGEGKCGGSI